MTRRRSGGATMLRLLVRNWTPPAKGRFWPIGDKKCWRTSPLPRRRAKR